MRECRQYCPRKAAEREAGETVEVARAAERVAVAMVVVETAAETAAAEALSSCPAEGNSRDANG